MGATFFVLDLRDNLDGLLDDVIDLVLPRGSNKLASQIKSSTKIHFLGHADGICHVYVDKSAYMEMAKNIALMQKQITLQPETLLVHKDLMENGGVNALLIELQSKGVSINGGPRASSMLNLPSAPSYYHEYGSLACTIEMWMMCMLPLIIYTSMEDVTSKKLLLFVGILLVFPLFVHPLETSSSTYVRRLLKNSRPRETTMNTTSGAATHAGFHAAAHEVPSGPNPESNR
ncbi:hypothetical protein L1987_33439 [Smallanthus sonchifolius]|uniref:Uncharacterized protein n=1 Tax=Smallanthus sonchifolius TaxID=185202 RepID=A0ACB9HSR1_9ASTR|nr:hypothetical protein L1987_33439 [Smallanthus sonchifolius]